VPQQHAHGLGLFSDLPEDLERLVAQAVLERLLGDGDAYVFFFLRFFV